MEVVSEGLYVLRMLERIFTDMPNVTEGLNKLFREVTDAHGSGQISDRTANRLHQEIHDRRQRQVKGSEARSRVGFHVAPILKAVKRDSISAPEDLTPEAALHAAELARRARKLVLRRWLAAIASIPADISQHFSTAEQSVLSFVALKCRFGEKCDFPVAAIAGITQVSERTVQSTIRKAERMGFVAVEYRKRLTNIVRVVSQVWRDWWARSTPLTESQKCLFSYENMDPLLGAKSVRDTPVQARKPMSEVAPVEAVDVAVLEAPVPAPRRVVPVVARARPKPVEAEPSNLEQIEAAQAAVEETAKTRPSDISDADPWELPEPEPWMTSLDRSWLREWETVEKLTPARYPHVFNENGTSIRENVLRWLRDHLGSGGNAYGFHRFHRPRSEADTRIGFRSRMMAVEFRLKWGGA